MYNLALLLSLQTSKRYKTSGIFSMGEKTEKATPKKLKDAKKKGQVAKSQDLPSAFTFIASIWITLGLIGYIYGKIADFIHHVFDIMTRNDIAHYLPQLFYEGIIIIFLCAIPVMLLVSFLGMTVTFLSIGPVFAPEVFKFDIKKFNPVQNLKAKFKLKTLFELVKSIFKISVAAYLIYGVVMSALPVLVRTVDQPIEVGLWVYYNFLLEVIIKVGIFFIAVAVVDFIYQKRNFASEMKMEKFEVKQEYKNTEGDPLIKGKRRQFAQEIAYQDSPSAGVRKARAVVTNPTHLAIAIGYQRDLDPAPYIVGLGEGILAEQMIKLAEKYNVPVVRNIPLAHKLWKEGELFEYIPEECYEAVAEILRWIQRLEMDPDTNETYSPELTEL
jgi:type III secretion protein U